MAPTLEEPVPYAGTATELAQSLVETPCEALALKSLVQEQPLEELNYKSYIPGHAPSLDHFNYAYNHLKPSFPDIQWPALEEVQYTDKGLLGSTQFKSLLLPATSIKDYTTKIGTEISGMDLSTLTDSQKNDLARLIATRCVVVFRDQKNFGVQEQRELGRYWGVLHRHATTAVPIQGDLNDVHVVWAGEEGRDARSMFAPGFLWHSDVTYEIQPLSYTSLKIITSPPEGTGGDTLFCSQYAAYDLLSPAMQKYLEALTALHSSHIQAEGSRALGRTVRRDPIITEHPLVRTNPVTGWKSLFFNRGFVVAIKGVPKVESEWLMRFLGEIVAESLEGQARFQWKENDVVFWDNRVTNHSATYGFTGHRRHAIRVACQAEIPYFDPKSRSQEEELGVKYGLSLVNKDGSGQSNYND